MLSDSERLLQLEIEGHRTVTIMIDLMSFVLQLGHVQVRSGAARHTAGALGLRLQGNVGLTGGSV